MYVDLGGILTELVEDDGDVVFGGEHEDEFELRDFDVDRVVVFAKEDSNIAREDLRTLLEDENCITEGQILDFEGLGQKGDQWW
jgi:hypothetical protein